MVARNPELAERRKQVLHTVLERNPEEAAAPIVAAHKEAAAAAHSTEEVAAPIVAAHKAVEVVRKAAVAADSDLAADPAAARTGRSCNPGRRRAVAVSSSVSLGCPRAGQLQQVRRKQLRANRHKKRTWQK